MFYGKKGGAAGTPGGTMRAGLTYVDGTCVEMLQTRTVRRNNTSGVTGVEWLPAINKWTATLCFKGEHHYLGSYRSFEDAVKARKQAEERYFETFLREFAGENRDQAPDG